MHTSTRLPVLLLLAVAAQAQEPPRPVTAPVRPSAERPANTMAAPRAARSPGEVDELELRGLTLRGRMANELTSAQAPRVNLNSAGQAAAAATVRSAQEAFRSEALAASVNQARGQIAERLSTVRAGSAGIGRSFSGDEGCCTVAQAYFPSQWGFGDQDPADSLYGAGREALNRGDWRRAADMFSQVHVRFPRSTRIVAAAYYEAFSRYRIGTTDELRVGLRVLADRGKGATQTNTQQEIASLTTRIRGALAARGDAEAARLLSVDAQKGGCDDEEVQVKSEALSALAQADMVAATPMLRRVLDKRDPCLLNLRRRALSILLRRGDTAATSAAIAVAKSSDETLELRTDAISYLSRLPGDNALSALEDLLRNSTDRDVQRAAVRSLANSESSRARQTVRAIIDRNDVSEQLRAEAINSMERDPGMGRADDAAYLRELFPKLQAERLKMAAIAAISKTPGTENEQWVLAIARNKNESSEVRADAIKRMYRIKSISIDEIGKLYEIAESRTMREQIISVLGQRTEADAVDKLLDLYKLGTDPRLQSQILNVLVKKNDPRAKKLLADIVGR